MEGLSTLKQLDYSYQLIESLELLVTIKNRFLGCYRMSTNPTERMFDELEKTKKKIKSLNEKLERN